MLRCCSVHVLQFSEMILWRGAGRCQCVLSLLFIERQVPFTRQADCMHAEISASSDLQDQAGLPNLAALWVALASKRSAFYADLEVWILLGFGALFAIA